MKSLFSDQEIKDLTGCMRPDEPTGLNYYPLTRPGERFPIADPDLVPRLSPRPDDDARFFQGAGSAARLRSLCAHRLQVNTVTAALRSGILESIARIEGEAYDALRDLGCSPLRRVCTAGGGSKNAAWTRIRERVLGVPVQASLHGACDVCSICALARAPVPVRL